MRTLTLLCVLVSASCGDPPNVGGTCAATDDCDDTLTCSTAIAGGYCTKSCTTSGSTDGCPEGSICDSVSGAGNTCVKVCKTSEDCGRSDLDCNGVSSSNVKACKPN
jgi:hypothetical protein